MRRKLYGNSIEPACEYCINGRPSSDRKAILCNKKGVMPFYHRCRKYRYDPLRRVPSRPPEFKEYSADDFSLDWNEYGDEKV